MYSNFSVETNFISPPVIVKLVKALLNTKAIEEFRCSNQVRRTCTQPTIRTNATVSPAFCHFQTEKKNTATSKKKLPQ